VAVSARARRCHGKSASTGRDFLVVRCGGDWRHCDTIVFFEAVSVATMSGQSSPHGWTAPSAATPQTTDSGASHQLREKALHSAGAAAFADAAEPVRALGETFSSSGAQAGASVAATSAAAPPVASEILASEAVAGGRAFTAQKEAQNNNKKDHAKDAVANWAAAAFRAVAATAATPAAFSELLAGSDTAGTSGATAAVSASRADAAANSRPSAVPPLASTASSSGIALGPAVSELLACSVDKESLATPLPTRTAAGGVEAI